MKELKTTRSQFSHFKETFLEWQHLLGCVEFRATFELAEIPNAFADIEVDQQGKYCHVRLVDKVYCDANMEVFDPAACGKHEAIHLFLSKLLALAKTRCVTEREIDNTEEGMVRVLEKLL